MSNIELFHGGETAVREPLALPPKFTRSHDFGLGFYGILSKDEAIVRLRTYQLVDQVFFHSAAALRYLAFVDSEVVS